MAAKSAGLLLYRTTDHGEVEVLIAHPGGPFWAGKDEGAWTVPKGEYEAGRRPPRRGVPGVPGGDGFRRCRAVLAIRLGELRQPGGKRVTVWALEGDLDVAQASSNTFEIEWPPRSGKVREFPEVDRLEWAGVSRARAKLLAGQVPFLDRLLDALRRRADLASSQLTMGRPDRKVTFPGCTFGSVRFSQLRRTGPDRKTGCIRRFPNWYFRLYTRGLGGGPKF